MTAEIESEYLPVWEPGMDVPAWAAKLLEPFPLDEIGLRPQVWCKDCRESKTKYCGKQKDDQFAFGVDHVVRKCPDCGQKVSKAHMHLYYVGHAHATRRLLETDIRWTWEPMERDIDPEVLKAAVATGDQFIVQQVLAAFPPKLTVLELGGGRFERGLWINLIVHDEHGNPVVTPGFGDAKGKAWGPDAMKEIIGDAIRNAMMRRGGALALWEKQDLEQAKKDATQDSPDSYANRAAVFDDDAKQDAEKTGQTAQARRRPARQSPEDTGKAGINPEAQAAADLAYQIAASGDGTLSGDLGKLQAAHEDARKKRILGLHCLNPVSREEKTTVLKVFVFAREQIESRAAVEG